MNLKFGTGGLRATMGPGPDHLNLETIQEATLGVAAYAKEQSDNPSAAIAYDSRNHSEEFAREAARVLALKGCRAYIYPKLTPTPALSFAVRHLKCTVGICVTASHNPREYNGYKVYGSDGCQVTSEAATSEMGSAAKTSCRSCAPPGSMQAGSIISARISAFPPWPARPASGRGWISTAAISSAYGRNTRSSASRSPI